MSVDREATRSVIREAFGDAVPVLDPDPRDPARVVVKFADWIEVLTPTPLDVLLPKVPVSPAGAPAALPAGGALPDVVVHPLVSALTPVEVRAWMARAKAADPTYRPRNLLSFAYVTPDEDANASPDALAARLAALPFVETAYVDRPAPDPSVDASNVVQSTFVSSDSRHLHSFGCRNLQYSRSRSSTSNLWIYVR